MELNCIPADEDHKTLKTSVLSNFDFIYNLCTFVHAGYKYLI